MTTAKKASARAKWVLARLACVVGVAATLVALPPQARGQNLVERSFATQMFEPAIGADPLLGVDTTAVSKHLGFQIGLMLSYQREPLVISSQQLDPVTRQPVAGSTSDVALVASQMTTDITAAIGLHYGWLRSELGVGFPVHMLLGGNEVGPSGRQSGELTGTGIGDVRLHLKVQLLPRRAGVALALAPVVTLPTACASAGSCAEEGRYGGEASVTVRPRLVADYRAGDLLVAANVGWLFREDVQVFSSTVGDRLMYGVGASYTVLRQAQVLTELYGQAGLGGEDCRDAGGTEVCNDGSHGVNDFPLELLLAGRYEFDNGLGVLAGAGVGLIRGIGAPQFRVLAGLRWKPDFTDRDGDGLRDRVDGCPTQAEDKDGYRDTDGCPDPDNDGDLIADTDDKCPLVAEDRDGYQDGDGCPEKDNDGDGIEDRLDHCPFKAETKNGYKDDDGCPDVLDRDRDGLPDDKDGCPAKAETVNGYLDGDGCPDQGDLKIGKAEIALLKPIAFVRRKAKIKDGSHATLDQLALALKNIPAIKTIAVHGRARKLKRKKYRRLWVARIAAVRKYLTDRGVAEERVLAGQPQQLLKDAGAEVKEGIVIAIVERKDSKQ